ncbi:cytochrome c oxidase cbb3-type subunit 3 [Geothermobacter ehrlichii]|uniref:Cytochrome c oxidase cbb3-type subunit 3 n=1 Tax=Geothermobacter ehrlichii TaxID=213224 RepID=A0A5D3WN68_9BACT|nr:c-type cytochrome [Geothermobacter ehrlichii]TYO98775.1 cytochrome c oxidase cbb3-type subunit 3 [Geothermobacter ehrlichii]
MTAERNNHHDADGIVENRERRPPAYFNILFFGLIIWAVIFMAYYLFSGWSSEEEFRQAMQQHRQTAGQQAPAPAPMTAAAPGVKDESADRSGDAEKGEKLFAARCAMCHGQEGKGGIGPDLTGKTYRYGNDEASIGQSITNGRPKGMPAFGNQLSPEKIADLTAFVLSLQH